MIYATGYALRCDVCGFLPNFTDVHPAGIRGRARTAGWKFGRRKDGQYARRGGRDYCPDCVAKAGWTAAP